MMLRCVDTCAPMTGFLSEEKSLLGDEVFLEEDMFEEGRALWCPPFAKVLSRWSFVFR
jgi:hypothetical protein